MLKLYKRTLSLLLVAIMLLPASTSVFAAGETSEYKRAENLLVGLNIVDRDEADVQVTRARFADIFAKAMNIYDNNFVPANPFSDTQESDYYEAIEILHDRNYISGVGNNNFAPENLMRVEDIARLYVCALGLEMYPESNNITFWTAANRLGLLKNVSYTDEITLHNLIIMTYNLLAEAPIGKIQFGSLGSKSYTVDSSDNLLYQNFNILKETGVVSENSVSGNSSVSNGYVKIKLPNGTVTALEGNTDISNYLGYTVDVYIEYGDKANRVICYEVADNSNTCIINISDISFEESSLSRIVYDNGKSTKKVSIASLPSVIYNGEYYEGEFNLNTLQKYDGTVTLIKSGSGSNYDTINIVAYTDYFVSNVEYYNGEMRVFDKGNNSNLILNDNDSKIKIYYPNGAEASMYELQANMLLTVMKSTDLKNVTIYICDNTESVDIKSIKTNERSIVTKDGDKYKVAASFPIENIELGKNTKLFFDYLGNIGWAEVDINYGYSYAIVRSVKYKRKDVILNTFVKAGEFTNFTLAEKVRIDGVSYKDAQEQIDVLSNIKGNGFEPGYYPMRYVLDDDGKIKIIDTPTYNKGMESKDSLRLCLSPRKTSYTSDGVLGKQIIISDSAKVFSMPGDVSLIDNYEYYNVGGKSMIGAGEVGNVMAFQTKENSIYADLVVELKTRWGYAPVSHDSQLFLIEKITDVYDEVSGEIVKEVSGIEGGVEKTYRTHAEFDKKDELDDLGKGDIVRFALFNGQIHNIRTMFKNDRNDTDNLGTYFRNDDVNEETKTDINYDMYFCGYVRSREGNFLKIWTPSVDLSKDANNNSIKLPAEIPIPRVTSWENDGTWSNPDTYPEGYPAEYRIIQAKNIAVYDPNLGKNGSVYIGDLEDIPYYEGSGEDAFVIMRYRSRSPQEIVVIKKKR